MKKIIAILFSVLPLFLMAQFPNTHQQGNSHTREEFPGAVNPLKGLINARYVDTLTANGDYISHYAGAQIVVGNTILIRDSTATKWNESSGGGGGSLIAGGPITSIPLLGDNPGTNITSDQFILNSFYKSQAPTASLSGGVNLEYRSPQTMNYTLSWTAGRQGATEPLATITVAGVGQSFSQPAKPGTVSGTQAVSFAANTDITYQNVVTTTDGKSTTATTTFHNGANRYSGWINVSDTVGIRTFGYNDSKITGLGNEFSSAKAKTWNTGNPTGTQIYVYAYYYTAGALSNLTLNGFPSISAFNTVQRNFTNALGFTGQWIIYWNKNGQTLASDIIAN